MTRNFTLASQVEILLRTAICQAPGCTNPLVEGVEWDHTIPWAISKDRSPKNGQALCSACHAIKTNEESFGGKSDKTTIAKCKRLHEHHVNGKPVKGNIQGRKLEGGQKFQSRPFKQLYTLNTKYIHDLETGDANVSE